MHSKTTLAIVINKKNICDRDVLVTLLTPHLGKIVCLAKGAHNIKSSRLGNIQLGNIIKAHLYQKNDFLWLSESENISPFLKQAKSLSQINLVFYFLELLNLLIAENQHIDNIYQIATLAIQAINQNSFNQFINQEISLLHNLGFGLPPKIDQIYHSGNLKSTQNLLKSFFESIVEKKLESNKLFH